MHYYLFNIGDYSSHTSHLTELEDLAYRRLLDWCYLHEKPLPDDIEVISKFIRMRTHSDCIANVLREFFELTEDGWISSRVQIEIDKVNIKSDKARQSANARWDKKKTTKNANAMRPQSERNATQDTLPITQNTNKQAVRPHGVSESVWNDFLTLRAKQKKPFTETALKGFIREAEKANWTLEEAFECCCERGWQGFKSDWVDKKTMPTNGVDPALKKIKEDAKAATPMPEAVRALIRNVGRVQ